MMLSYVRDRRFVRSMEEQCGHWEGKDIQHTLWGRILVLAHFFLRSVDMFYQWTMLVNRNTGFISFNIKALRSAGGQVVGALDR